jgi:protein-S-isoprenylcysteine O-methyltransferase Ste14
VSLLGGWLPLVVYFLGLTAAVLTYPKDKRKKLFLEPSYPRGNWRRAILLVGRIAAVSYCGLMVVTPMRVGSRLLIAGLAVCALGYALVIVALAEYRRAPADRPVERGVCRFSRNPQWIGLVLVFVGIAIAVGGWLHLILTVVLVVAYHFQILLEEQSCLGLYGEEYRAYLARVPRYLVH